MESESSDTYDQDGPSDVDLQEEIVPLPVVSEVDGPPQQSSIQEGTVPLPISSTEVDDPSQQSSIQEGTVPLPISSTEVDDPSQQSSIQEGTVPLPIFSTVTEVDDPSKQSSVQERIVPLQLPVSSTVTEVDKNQLSNAINQELRVSIGCLVLSILSLNPLALACFIAAICIYSKAVRNIRMRNYDRATGYKRVAKNWRSGGIYILVIPLIMLAVIVATGTVLAVVGLIGFGIIVLFCLICA